MYYKHPILTFSIYETILQKKCSACWGVRIMQFLKNVFKIKSPLKWVKSEDFYKKKQVYKPDSVSFLLPKKKKSFYHLSSSDITIGVNRSTPRDRTSSPYNLAKQDNTRYIWPFIPIRFTLLQCCHYRTWALTSRFHPYHNKLWRLFSVALAVTVFTAPSR